MVIRHPECDVRPWLEENAGSVTPYTRQRITQSYQFMGDLLARCEGTACVFAYDVGSGAGYDTFAIGRYFDQVLAIDRDRRAIREASLIAGGAGVSRIRFERANVECKRGRHQFDLVYCNLMSHNVSSRCALFTILRQVLRPKAHLLYSEITEGYAPMEIHRAIIGRDRVQLFSRIQQVLRGLTGQSGFRFFLAGTAQSLLEVNNLCVLAHQSQAWNGMRIFERTTAKAERGTPAQARCPDVDYHDIHADFAEMRAQFTTLLSARPRSGFSPDQRRQIEARLHTDGNRYAPFLTFLLMADVALPSFRLTRSPFRRSIEVGRRVGRRLGFAWDDGATGEQLDWAALQELDLGFIEDMRRRVGLPMDSVDD